MSGRIRVGIGGWTYEPWRGTFFPDGHPHKRELEYASSQMSAIEINGTYYSTQKPATWADWARRTPDDFVFSVKASRFCTNRKVLAEAGESMERFAAQGLEELGDKLGPILWQFMASRDTRPDGSAIGGVHRRQADHPAGPDRQRPGNPGGERGRAARAHAPVGGRDDRR